MTKINETTSMKLETTKRGFPALWESGGGMSNTGRSQIICGRNGEARRPIYQPRGGHLACGNHALITVHEGFYIVKASQHRGTYSLVIYKILKLKVQDLDGEGWEAKADILLINRFSEGEWDILLEEKFEAAVSAARRKSCSYHCRSAYYVDLSDKPERSKANKDRQNAQMKKQDISRAAKREAKAEREAKAKADAEDASKIAKDAGLGARLEALNVRREKINLSLIEFRNCYYENWGRDYLYTEENISSLERDMTFSEKQFEAKRLQKMARNEFQPRFEAFAEELSSYGKSISFSAEKVSVDYSSFSYSEKGLDELQAIIQRFEQERLAQIKREEEKKLAAIADAKYQELRVRAEDLSLPQNIQIWKRSGKTNAGKGWVINRDGICREPTSMHNDNPRRLQRYGEGFMIWEQILEGELVLQWAKAYTAAEHEFFLVYLPKGGVSDAQLKRVKEIEEGISHSWAGATGMASGKPSPSIRKGWGLGSVKKEEKSLKGEFSLSDLQSKFSK